MRNWLCAAVFLCGLVVATGMALVRAQDANQSVIHPHAGLKLTTFPDIPTCALGASESGDPTKEASTLFIHFAAGCNVPWHWHTPAETILMVSGVLRAEMKGGGKPLYMHAGDYAMMPSHNIHQARCVGTVPCVLFIHSDSAFDIHYVDASGNEISMSDALKMAAKPMPKAAAKSQ